MFHACAVATGSWGAQLAAVTESDSSARHSRLRAARPRAPTCCPSPPDSDGERCVFGGWQPFSETSCQSLTGTRLVRCAVDLVRSGSWEELAQKQQSPRGSWGCGLLAWFLLRVLV